MNPSSRKMPLMAYSPLDQGGLLGKPALKKLAGEVFIRLPFAIGVAVEPDEHRHVAGHAVQQLPETSHRVFADQVVLGRHVRHRLHLGIRGGEVAVPEQGHLFAIAGRGKQSLDQSLVRARRGVRQECPNFGRLRGQSCQIERCSPQQGQAIGLDR